MSANQLARDLTIFAEAESFSNEYHDLGRELLKGYKMYFDAKDEEDWPYPHAVHTPDTFALTEDATAKLLQATTHVDPIISVKPRLKGGLENELLAQQLTRVLAWFLSHQDGEFYHAYEDFIRTGCLFGTGYLKITPKFKQANLEGLPPSLEYIKFEDLDYWAVYPDARSVRINKDCNYLIVREDASIYGLKAAEAAGFPYKNIDQLEQLANAEGGYITDEGHRQVLQEIGIQPYIPANKNEIELLYIFERGNLRIIAGRAVYIYESEDNPFVYGIPIVDFRFVPQPQEFFGVGVPWMIRDLQLMKNVLWSQRLTNTDLVLSPPMRVTPGCGLDPENLVFYPGSVIPAQQGDIGWEPVPDVTRTAHVENEAISLTMEDVTGLTKPARGIPVSKRQTKGEFFGLQQAALVRFDSVIKRIERALREVGRRISTYIRVYMDRTDYERICGESDAGFYNLTVDDIINLLDFVPVGTSVTAIKQIRLQQAMQAYQTLASIPPQVAAQNLGGKKGFTIDYFELLNAVLEAMEIPGRDRLLVPLTQPQPAQSPNPEQLTELLASMGANQGAR